MRYFTSCFQKQAVYERKENEAGWIFVALGVLMTHSSLSTCKSGMCFNWLTSRFEWAKVQAQLWLEPASLCLKKGGLQDLALNTKLLSIFLTALLPYSCIMSMDFLRGMERPFLTLVLWLAQPGHSQCFSCRPGATISRGPSDTMHNAENTTSQKESGHTAHVGPQ